MENLALHSAEEPDTQRAITGTAEVPTKRDNDAALALGARPIQQHEPAARHIMYETSIYRTYSHGSYCRRHKCGERIKMLECKLSTTTIVISCSSGQTDKTWLQSV